MDDNGGFHDFFSQTASSGAAVHPIDDDGLRHDDGGWGQTSPRFRRDTGFGGRVPASGALGGPRIGLENLDLNADGAAVSYPNMNMYTNLLRPGSSSSHGMPPQRARSDGVAQRQGRPPRQGLPPVRAPDRRGKVSGMSGRAGAGSSRSSGGRQRQAVPIVVGDAGEEDEDEEDDSMLNQHNQRPKSKANWTDENTYTLCEIACEEIEVGNYTGRVWQPQAYKNIREKYWQRAKLWHPGREIRNKMTNLKTLYTDWVWLQQQTGCGRDPHGEVTATPAWWEREIKTRPNLKKFRKGNPEYMPLLHEIYHEVAVDGTSAYVPGTEDNFEINNGDGLDDNEGFVPSPMSTNTQKRGSGSVELRSTASSPSKRSKTSSLPDSDSIRRTHGKTKGPFVKYMKDIETKLEKEAEKTDSILQALVNQSNEKARRSEERSKSVETCPNLAIECGATEESVEYFVACDLFKSKHNRYVFRNIKTPEARLTWLKRWCRAKNMYEADGGIRRLLCGVS